MIPRVHKWAATITIVSVNTLGDCRDPERQGFVLELVVAYCEPEKLPVVGVDSDVKVGILEVHGCQPVPFQNEQENGL